MWLEKDDQSRVQRPQIIRKTPCKKNRVDQWYVHNLEIDWRFMDHVGKWLDARTTIHDAVFSLVWPFVSNFIPISWKMSHIFKSRIILSCKENRDINES